MNRKDFRPNDNNISSSKTYKPIQPKEQVVKSFIKGQGGKTGNDSLTTDGRTLYSYNTAIAVRQSDGTILVNNTKYSVTTTKQQYILIKELKENNVKYDVTGGKDRGYRGEDFSEEKQLKADIKDEKDASKHYKEMSNDEKEHAKILEKQLQKDKSDSVKHYKTSDNDYEYESFQPKSYEDGYYVVHAHKKGTLHTDKNTDVLILHATSEQNAISKYKKMKKKQPYLSSKIGISKMDKKEQEEIKNTLNKNNKKLYSSRDKDGVSIRELTQEERKQYAPNSNVRYEIRNGDTKSSAKTLKEAKIEQKRLKGAYIKQSNNMTTIDKDKIIINVNHDNEQSIKNAEKKKSELENKGYTHQATFQNGFNKHQLIYKKQDKDLHYKSKYPESEKTKERKLNRQLSMTKRYESIRQNGNVLKLKQTFNSTSNARKSALQSKKLHEQKGEHGYQYSTTDTDYYLSDTGKYIGVDKNTKAIRSVKNENLTNKSYRMSLSEIKAKNTNAGQYFFSPATMKTYRQVNAKYRVKYDKKTDTNYVIVNMKKYPESNERKEVVYKYNKENGHLDIQ